MASFKSLPPEIREIIYGYALAFETPLSHVNRMQPFVKKLTGVDGEIPVASCFLQRDPGVLSESTEESSLESDSERDTKLDSGSDSEPTSDHGGDVEINHDSECISRYGSGSDHEDERTRVNTAILTVDKRTYKEAIAVFYKINVIHFDFDLVHMTMTSPHGSDLSLATRVFTRAGTPLKSLEYLQVMHTDRAVAALSNMLPTLSEATLQVTTDSSFTALLQLFEYVRQCRLEAPRFNARFDGVGSVAADIHPRIHLALKYDKIVQHWRESANDPYPAQSCLLNSPSARTLKRMKEDGRLERHGRIMTLLQNVYNSYLLDDIFEDDEDSYEFWTVIEDWLVNADIDS